MIHDFSVISNSPLSIETPEEANDQERLKEQPEIMALLMLCIWSWERWLSTGLVKDLRIRFIFNLIFFLGAEFQQHLPEEVFC